MKLTKIENPRNVYKLILTFMFGDADGYESVELKYKTQEEFIQHYNVLDSCPDSPGSGGDQAVYRDWWTENFGCDIVPYDPTCDIQSAYDGRKGIYYDENGDAFKITF